MLEQPREHERDLVGGALWLRGQPPGVDEPRAVEDPEHRFGVADVGREQHRALPVDGCEQERSIVAHRPSGDNPLSARRRAREQQVVDETRGREPRGDEGPRGSVHARDRLEGVVADHGDVVEAGPSPSPRSLGPSPRRAPPSPARRPAPGPAASDRARKRQPACSRSSGASRALRDEHARPSDSRTVAHRHDRDGQRLLAHHPPDEEQLLGVLQAEDGAARPRHVEEAMDDLQHTAEVPGPGRALERVADRPRIGLREEDSVRVDLVDRAAPRPRRRPTVRRSPGPRPRRADTRARSSPGPNWAGFTKIVTST